MLPIPIRKQRPSGHRILHEPVDETEQAVQFRYYTWILWIPRSALVKVERDYTAPAWAIDSAKEHASAVKYRDEADAIEAVQERLGTGPSHAGPVVGHSRV